MGGNSVPLRMAKNESSARFEFGFFHGRITTLLGAIECLHERLNRGHPVDQQPGWRELKSRPLISLRRREKPWLVATLFGPTGSGKSTVFGLLTGLEVPAGDVIRPVTFNALIAIPESLAKLDLIKELFPFAEVSPLLSIDQLKDKTHPREALFFASYKSDSPGRQLDLILADVPDFDTIYRRNWEKAEAMMSRAEVVLFTLYPAAYMDAAVLQNLEKCCTHAGKLILLFNKSESAAQAEAIWLDLLKKIRAEAEFESFQKTRRQDGLFLSEFLANCDAYYSLRSAELRFDQIRPLSRNAPSLGSLLTGLEGFQVLWSSLSEDTAKAIGACRALCARRDGRLASLQAKIDIAESHLRHAAEIVAGTCFPAGRMTELILDVMREYRPFWVKLIGLPANLVSKALAKSRLSLSQMIAGKTKPMPELERERLSEVLDDLITALRADLPEAELTMEQTRTAREGTLSAGLPKPSEAWAQAVTNSAREWAEKNPWKTKVLGSVHDVLLMLGGAMVGVDLLVAGGQGALWGSLLAGKLGLVGAAGAGGAAAGALLGFFEKIGLRSTLEVADESWRSQRIEEIRTHLRERLISPLFLELWQEEKQQLSELDCAAFRAACDDLERFLFEQGKASRKAESKQQ